MALKYALLGFLNLRPKTGYDLKKSLDLSTQHFWYAGINQIYPTLKTLEETGWIRSRVEPQDGRPDKKVYRITKTGRKRFLEWLSVPPQKLPRGKNEALLKLFFAGFLDTEGILRQLRIQLELHRVQLAGYQKTQTVVREIVDASGRHREGALWELVRELGEQQERTYVRWLEKAIHTVKNMQ